ncbi:dTDP-4-dehydrorhamnose 3,5-epimerase [Glycocaulis profundi]|nr:dTDP-4-dehydrorhamnose 3,5-epimerase [Glycocaulis profundi]
MNVHALSLEGVKLIETPRFADARGFFTEAYSEAAFAEAGIAARFVQDNHSFSAKKGTVRGLHYQAPPFAQAKLVRVISGAILDVAVDARAGSPGYGRHVSAELSAENNRQIFVPAGFLHGFVTLTDACHVIYKVDAPYSRDHDGAVRFDDPDLGIDWGIEGDAILSDKDAAAPAWRDFVSPFTYPESAR